MGFLDALSALTTPALQYRTGQMQGERQKQEREQDNFMTALKLMRQQQEDALNQRVKEAQIRNYDEKPVVKTPRKVMQLENGDIVSVNEETGEATPVTRDGGPEMQDLPDVPFMAGVGVPQEPTGRRLRVPLRGKVEPKNPVVGSEEWKAAERFRASLQPKQEPIVQVATPGDPQQGVYVTRSQALGKNAPQSAGVGSAINQSAKARMSAAISEMNNSDVNMADFEEKLKNGQIKIGASSQLLGRVASAFTHDNPIAWLTQSGALAALNQTDPELARYIRRGLSFAEGESMISQRPSDFRTKMSAFLSQAATGASPEMISDIQGRRKAILNPLIELNPTAAAHGTGSNAGAATGNINLGGGKPMSAAAYKAARAHGYSDAEIQAQGYAIPGNE